MKQILLDWKRNSHSVCAAVFYTSVLLWNVVFTGEAQAQVPPTLTWNYVSSDLIPNDTNSAQCPVNLGNFTISATGAQALFGVYYPFTFTMPSIG